MSLSRLTSTTHLVPSLSTTMRSALNPAGTHRLTLQVSIFEPGLLSHCDRAWKRGSASGKKGTPDSRGSLGSGSFT
jgi:hypothetical protein